MRAHTRRNTSHAPHAAFNCKTRIPTTTEGYAAAKVPLAVVPEAEGRPVVAPDARRCQAPCCRGTLCLHKSRESSTCTTTSDPPLWPLPSELRTGERAQLCEQPSQLRVPRP